MISSREPVLSGRLTSIYFNGGAMTKGQYEEYLNTFEIPDGDAKSDGGRIPDGTPYGSWLRRNDPIAFQVGYSDKNREQ